MDRREFLLGSMGAAILASWPAESFAQTTPSPRPAAWDAGRL